MTTTRLLLPAALALTLAASLPAHASDAPPSTPTDLVANAYSATAGGIRWSRSSDDRGAVGGYEVTRDGAVLDVRDALSYVDRALAPATTYTYGVTAIDSAGQRSGTATIRLRTNGGTPPGVLAAPTGLRTSVYSATAAELFWTRPATFGLRYEVLRDGAPLAIIDGTSYFDDTLSGGTVYAYDIIAIDREARRSASSRITLRTADASPSSAGPAAPTGLRASVYSGTAAELFWTRPATFGLRYEVLRGGAPLAVTDGTSYFDDTLSPGTTYVYDVVAIDREARRSASAKVTLTTFGDAAPPGGGDPFARPDPDGTTTIARLGYPAVRERVDELVATSYLALYYGIDLSPLGLPRGQSDEPEGFALDCPGGGSVSGTRSVFSFDVVLDDCTVDGVTLSGGLANDVDLSVFGFGTSIFDTVTFQALRIEAGVAGTLELTGTSRRSGVNYFRSECRGAVERTREVDNRIAAARLERGGEVTTVDQASWSQRFVTGMQLPDGAVRDDFGWYPPCTAFETLTLDGAAEVASTRFGPGTATLGKTADIVRDAPGEGGSSASARLAADFADGSTLAVTLTSDADAEVQVDIVADGAAVSFVDTYAFETRDDLPPVIGD